MLGRPKKLKKESKASSQMSPEQIAELIQKKAYEIYCQRGHTPGNEMHDWLKAEEMVRHELKMNS